MNDLILIPYPKIVRFTSGRCKLNKKIKIINNGCDPYVFKVFLDRTKLTKSHDGIELIVNLKKGYSIEENEYTLLIEEEKITITTAKEVNVIYALETLYQLIFMNDLRCMEIKDSPRHEYRGLHLDPCRNFYSIEETKKIIDNVSLFKINKIHWHLSDDQGWRIQSKNFPNLEAVSKNVYSQKEIKDVVEFARLRGIEVIPEIDMPGHMRAFLAAYPEYGCQNKKIKPATKGGIYPDLLCAGKEKVYEMIDKLFEEITPLFTSEYFHIGGDETYKKYWKECLDCKAALEKYHLKDFDELQGYFSNRVKLILFKYNKKAIFWDDSLLSANIDKDCIIQFWQVARKKQLVSFINNGGKFIASDMYNLYFDYPSSMTPLKKVYSFKPRIGLFSYNESKNFMGYEACSWSERIFNTKTLEERIFPRIIAVSEKAWSHDLNYHDFKIRLMKIKNILDVKMQDYLYWDPKGKARCNETMDYMRLINRTNEANSESLKSSVTLLSIIKFLQFFKISDLPKLIKVMKEK